MRQDVRPSPASSPEQLLYEGDGIRIGMFRCAPDHPEFHTAGVIEGYTVAFPRSAVWIAHRGRAAFVGDPYVATVYNLGQPYERRALASDGDRCEWISVSRARASAIVNSAVAAAHEIFPVSYVPVPMPAYLRQRALLNRLYAGAHLDPGQIEREVTQILRSVLTGVRARANSGGTERASSLAEAARAVVARDAAGQISVCDLAEQLGTSPFHLCRVFRRCLGTTLQHYRLELRCRQALEPLEAGDANLSRVALELGFSSHSHFAAEFHRRAGAPPSTLRRLLAV